MYIEITTWIGIFDHCPRLLTICLKAMGGVETFYVAIWQTEIGNNGGPLSATV
jgi:hypothetical protein